MKRKRTPEERERLRRVLEEGREARRYMQEVIDRIDRTILAGRVPPPPDRSS